MIPTISMINEQVIRMAHDGIHHEVEAMIEGHTGKKLGPGSLAELQNLLNAIAHSADDLAKVGLLIQEEKDPEKLSALQRLQVVLAKYVGDAVDYFIDDCEPHGMDAGGAPSYPGNYPILAEAFAPIKKHKGAKTPEAATDAAGVALERITWSIAHASDLVFASSRRKRLSDVESDLAKKPEQAAKED